MATISCPDCNAEMSSWQWPERLKYLRCAECGCKIILRKDKTVLVYALLPWIFVHLFGKYIFGQTLHIYASGITSAILFLVVAKSLWILFTKPEFEKFHEK